MVIKLGGRVPTVGEKVGDNVVKYVGLVLTGDTGTGEIGAAGCVGANDGCLLWRSVLVGADEGISLGATVIALNIGLAEVGAIDGASLDPMREGDVEGASLTFGAEGTMLGIMEGRSLAIATPDGVGVVRGTDGVTLGIIDGTSLPSTMPVGAIEGMSLALREVGAVLGAVDGASMLGTMLGVKEGVSLTATCEGKILGVTDGISLLNVGCDVA